MASTSRGKKDDYGDEAQFLKKNSVFNTGMEDIDDYAVERKITLMSLS